MPGGPVIDIYIFRVVFNVVDENGDEYIEFDEFLMAISITSRGELQEKLECKYIRSSLSNEKLL